MKDGDRNQAMHMCDLKSRGEQDLIESLSDKPVVACSRCGARANSIRNVCAVRLGAAVADDRDGGGCTCAP